MATAYLSVFIRPDGTWTNPGIYSEFPCEQVGRGSWAMIASFEAKDYDTARRKLKDKLLNSGNMSKFLADQLRDDRPEYL